jgi:MOSC domain-containing protein YiiM
MKLHSINVSQPRLVPYRGQTVAAGIFKEPVEGRVPIHRLGLDGDVQVDRRYHGGLNKAVYAYPQEHYPKWAAVVGRDLPHGQFGENLTTEGLLEDAVSLGDVYRVGTAQLEVTMPRTPCFKLGIKMGDAAFPKKFLASGKLGIYFRVLEEGEISVGDTIELLGRDEDPVTLRSLWHLCYVDEGHADLAARILSRYSRLGPEWRQPLEQRILDGRD